MGRVPQQCSKVLTKTSQKIELIPMPSSQITLGWLLDILSAGQFQPERVGGGWRFGQGLETRPLDYLHKLYLPVSGDAAEVISAVAGRPPPAAFLDFLTVCNGASLFRGRISITGLVLAVSRAIDGLGQPVSLHYGNTVERSPNLRDEDFRIGGLIGASVVASVAMCPDGHVKIVHPSQVGPSVADFPSLKAFLEAMVAHYGPFFDAAGLSASSGDEMMPLAARPWTKLGKLN